MNTADLKHEITGLIEAANDMAALEEIRITALGKKGKITGLMQNLRDMSPDERKSAGQALNVLKTEIANLIDSQAKRLKMQALNDRLATEKLDMTLSPRPETQGKIHPISQTMEEILTIFGEMGFALEEGPDIEDDYHNFTALNFPVGHPAREMHDTFYLPDDPDETGEAAKKVLRTHTSSVQIRAMENKKPPVKVLCMGRTYRSDYDITHTPMFHQCEGLVVDTETNMSHLKGCLMEFIRKFFEIDDLPVPFFEGDTRWLDHYGFDPLNRPNRAY